MLTLCRVFQVAILSLTSAEAFLRHESPPRIHGRCDRFVVRASVEFRSYQHKQWNLTYRFKPASPGFEKEDSYLLIHPVGIGLASWFWEKFLDDWVGPAVYAPNMIGCGVSEGSDPWDPDEQGLFFPLGWVQGCETLMNSVSTSTSSPLGFFRKPRRWTVVSQGGLAPVAVCIASRNPEIVQSLVLASPPTWEDMTNAIPEQELKRNYDFLRSPVLGKLAFSLLESRGAIRFFSDQFLFSSPCDERWLDNTEIELGPSSRPPVMAFNAGFCQNRSFEDDLLGLDQPTTILQGQDDKRKREKYVENMRRCSLVVLPGQNVLPWESSTALAKALSKP